MAAIPFLLLFAIFTTAAAQKISPGSSLTPTANSSWLSRSGLYAFGFYPQANGYGVGVFLIGIPQKTVVWTADRDNTPVPGNVTLLLSTDGSIILRPQQESSNTYIANPPEPASSASMLDSGNFVLYNSGGKIIWQSFDEPTEALVAGQRLLPGRELVSSASEDDHSKGIFRLKMQQDGNLVQYPVDTPDTAPYSYYSTGTMGRDNVTLNFNRDGFLYLVNSTGFGIANLTRGGYSTKDIYLMRIDVDGVFRLYSHSLDQNSNWSVKWESSSNKCDPKGLCGLNGFCVSNDQEADCKCLPGFDFVNQSHWSRGCQRNFTAEGCGHESGSIKYSIKPVDNTRWEDDSYSVLPLVTREECEESCLLDCNCEAALFNDDGNCRKQRLPLRYGRRQLEGTTSTALIKMGESTHHPPPEGILPSPVETKKELRMDILIIMGVLLAAFAAVSFALIGVLIYKNHVGAYRRTYYKDKYGFCEDVAPRSFPYEELEKVSGGFKDEIGKGSSATVYRGLTLEGRKEVAIKRLEKELANGEIEFQTEIKVIGKTYHRNLVQLLGYCLDGPKRLLVYEYMSNGSLADVLFNPAGNRPSWEERMGIVRDVARGLLYLHEECETQIIHCDIKPQNVLIDEYGRAKISDFGLAKSLKADQTRTFTAIRGTRGYVAPEWHRKLPVTVKVDVFSFGVMLLEIICCRRSVNFSLSDGEAILEEWVYSCFEAGELGKLVEDEEVDRKQLERKVRVGLWCIQDEPSLRPSMKKVLLMLEGSVDIPVPPSPTSFFSSV
ncbi:G-type lectin S-receptor-like serine/threonine-protein kinase LECRK3 [Malania oleifera]|uniref:G-type lectin S-receptor-like serine/threonine-protein kinase LECRK3 n=1 Tax=Malania oleifera TaxID=397392 RepID=UPI0025AE2A6B|nr:G-type lectin S-receptor-like serine/threonine-protein kinase LECRK3 [Malania oleifera]